MRARRGPNITPFSIKRTLKSVDSTTYNPVTGTVAVNYINLNSLTDPFGSISASVQPLGYDQHMAMYRHYCVIGWQVKVEYCTADNTNSVVVGCTVQPESTTSLSNYKQYMECKGTKSLMLTPDIDKGVILMSGSVKKWLMPRGGKLLTDDSFSGSVSSSPATPLYLHLWAEGIDSGIDPGNVIMLITIKQTAVFYSPVTPSRSTQ